MSETIVIRVLSQAGRSRVEIAPTQTIGDLKFEIAKRLSLDAKTVTLCSDQAYKKKFSAKDSVTLAKAGLKNGAQLFVANQDTQMTALPEKKELRTYEDIKKEEEKRAEEEPAKDSYGRVIKKVEQEEDDGTLKDSYGRVVQPAAKPQEAKKPVKMIYGAEEKRKQQAEDDDKFIKH